VVAGEAAEARAEALLSSHLTPILRAEWMTSGQLTVEKHGVVWGVLVRELVKTLPLLALILIPGWHAPAFVVAATVVVTFMPLWLPRVALACTRRRLWTITAHGSPVLRARGRTIRFCVAFREWLPGPDRVLAWKHLVEHSEGYLLGVANIRG
jgi:hypothetical protein